MDRRLAFEAIETATSNTDADLVGPAIHDPTLRAFKRFIAVQYIVAISHAAGSFSSRARNAAASIASTRGL